MPGMERYWACAGCPREISAFQPQAFSPPRALDASRTRSVGSEGTMPLCTSRLRERFTRSPCRVPLPRPGAASYGFQNL